MANVDPAYAEQLKADALYVTAAPPNAAVWGELAIETTIVSPFALIDGATIEATRQAAFLAGPLARDTHVVPGSRSDLIGQFVYITGDRLGYEGGSFAFVVGVEESSDGNVTTLSVIKRLA